MLSRKSYTLLLLAMVTLTGCGSGDNGPKTVPASGVVLLDGTPIDGAQVVFINEASQFPSYAQTDSKGIFSLQLSDEKKGAVPGTYKVQVSKTIMEEGKGEVNLKHGLPKKYGNFLQSGIEITIPEKAISDIKIELKSK